MSLLCISSLCKRSTPTFTFSSLPFWPQHKQNQQWWVADGGTGRALTTYIEDINWVLFLKGVYSGMGSWQPRRCGGARMWRDGVAKTGR